MEQQKMERGLCTMENNGNTKKRKVAYALDLEVSEKDIKQLEQVEAEKKKFEALTGANDVVPRFKARRTQKHIVDKFQTKIWELENMFISYQEGKKNSKQTIQFYKDSFKMIKRFLVFNYIENAEQYKAMLDACNGDELGVGGILPIVLLESDDFEQDYNDYLTNYASSKGEGGVKEQTVLKEFRGLRAILYYAMENGWIEKRTIHVKNIEPDIKQVYTLEELNALLVPPDRDSYVEYRNWVMINYFLSTGNRIGSALALKVGDIDFEDKMVNVNEQKNNKPVRIPLVDEIIPVLQQWIDDYFTNDDGTLMVNDALFGDNTGRHITVNTAVKSIAEYNKAHGVSKTSVHLFRHTFAKNWITSGGDLLMLQKMLNHQTLEMVRRYANLYSTDLQPAAQQHALISKVKATQKRQAKTRRK